VCEPAPSALLGQQQRGGLPALSGPPEGVPGPAGGPGAAGPGALPPRERPLQPDHHVRAGVVPQHAEEAGAAGGRGVPRGGQLQHAVPQTGLTGRGHTHTHTQLHTHTTAESVKEHKAHTRLYEGNGPTHTHNNILCVR